MGIVDQVVAWFAWLWNLIRYYAVAYYTGNQELAMLVAGASILGIIGILWWRKKNSSDQSLGWVLTTVIVILAMLAVGTILFKLFDFSGKMQEESHKMRKSSLMELPSMQPVALAVTLGEEVV